MHTPAYDRKLKATPEFQYLYHKWRWIRNQQYSDAFAQFMDFYKWSMDNGFKLNESRLEILDASKPCGPDNCRWYYSATAQREYTEEQKKQIASWNETVNRIRIHFGLEPFQENGDS